MPSCSRDPQTGQQAPLTPFDLLFDLKLIDSVYTPVFDEDGNAITKEEHDRDMELIKEVGAKTSKILAKRYRNIDALSIASEEELKKELSPQSNVLQIGATFGSQIDKTYSTIGQLGTYTIIDILPKAITVYNDNEFIDKIIEK